MLHVCLKLLARPLQIREPIFVTNVSQVKPDFSTWLLYGQCISISGENIDDSCILYQSGKVPRTALQSAHPVPRECTDVARSRMWHPVPQSCTDVARSRTALQSAHNHHLRASVPGLVAHRQVDDAIARLVHCASGLPLHFSLCFNSKVQGSRG